MKIQPKVRGFICTAAHPEGARQSVQRQIEYIKQQPAYRGPQRVLVIGASTGYGLASRIAATFGAGAKTIGLSFEKPASGKRTASAGWYNTAAFEAFAEEDGHYARSLNGDAFSDEMKQAVIELIKQEFGTIDLLVYSLASPRRTDPKTGETFSSVLKTIGAPYHNKTVDPMSGEVKDITIEPATDEEIADTIKVMGGEDWALWIEQLQSAGVLAEGFMTTAYSYVGPALTHPIYKDGTIGRAKDHLQETAEALTDRLSSIGGKALISVNKALVTQASSAIPVVPLYISILYKLMKAAGTHEGCIEQMDRLFRKHLYADDMKLDAAGRIRVDDLEMQASIQEAVEAIWPTITTDNLMTLTDMAGYRDDFYQLFGFHFEGIDYEADVDPEVSIPSIAKD